MTASEIKKFVQSMKVGSPGSTESAKPVAFKDKTESAYVIQGSIASFTEGFSAQHKEDVVNSLCLVANSADYLYDRFDQMAEWYKYYQGTLVKLGWVLDDFSMASYSSSSSSFSLDKVLIDLLTAIASQDQLLIIKSAISALKALPSTDDAIQLFNRHAYKSTRGNFQVCAAREVDGLVDVAIGCLDIHASGNITDILWFHYKSSEASLLQATQNMTLSEKVYAEVREDVIKKLGVLAQKTVREIPLPSS